MSRKARGAADAAADGFQFSVTPLTLPATIRPVEVLVIAAHEEVARAALGADQAVGRLEGGDRRDVGAGEVMKESIMLQPAATALPTAGAEHRQDRAARAN